MPTFALIRQNGLPSRTWVVAKTTQKTIEAAEEMFYSRYPQVEGLDVIETEFPACEQEIDVVADLSEPPSRFTVQF